MNYGISNYTNSLNSLYSYNYLYSNKAKNTASLLSAFNSLNSNGVGFLNSLNSTKNSYVNSNALTLLSDMKTGGKNILKSLSDVTKAASTNKQQAVSSNKDVLSINSKSMPISAFKETEMSISQIATGQINKGDDLSASAVFGKTGLQQFQIDMNGTKHQFFIDVKYGDSNKAVQQKMAAAINGRNIGITAAVSEDAAKKTSSLTVQSQTTGADNKNAFSLQDISGALVSMTGARNTSQAAQDAIYKINGGEEQRSKSNTIDLSGGVTVNLLKAGGANVTVKKDTNGIVDAVKSLVNSYNSLYKTGASSSEKLSGELFNAYRPYSSSLLRMGISINSDGVLSVDDSKLAKAAEDGSVERFFTQSGNYGFSARLTQVANNVSKNPAPYMNINNYLNNLMSGSDSSSYKNLTAGYLFNIYA